MLDDDSDYSTDSDSEKQQPRISHRLPSPEPSPLPPSPPRRSPPDPTLLDPRHTLHKSISYRRPPLPSPLPTHPIYSSLPRVRPSPYPPPKPALRPKTSQPSQLFPSSNSHSNSASDRQSPEPDVRLPRGYGYSARTQPGRRRVWFVKEGKWVERNRPQTIGEESS